MTNAINSFDMAASRSRISRNVSATLGSARNARSDVGSICEPLFLRPFNRMLFQLNGPGKQNVVLEMNVLMQICLEFRESPI
jgi:hypothetical protein